MKENKIDNKKLKKALIKKALGYDTKEIVEEYVQSDEGDIKLSKKKVTKKAVPPDMTALKLLMEEDLTDIDRMTDEELEYEKQRLLEKIKKEEKEKGENLWKS